MRRCQCQGDDDEDDDAGDDDNDDFDVGDDAMMMMQCAMIPVPMSNIAMEINLGSRFFWKVIVDGKSNRGIAMLGSNNPHAAQTPPCTNITQEVS